MLPIRHIAAVLAVIATMIALAPTAPAQPEPAARPDAVVTTSDVEVRIDDAANDDILGPGAPRRNTSFDDSRSDLVDFVRGSLDVTPIGPAGSYAAGEEITPTGTAAIVVRDEDDRPHGFLRNPLGRVVALSDRGFRGGVYPFGVNRRGVVVGEGHRSDESTAALRWSPSGVSTNLGTLGGTSARAPERERSTIAAGWSARARPQRDRHGGSCGNAARCVACP